MPRGGARGSWPVRPGCLFTCGHAACSLVRAPAVLLGRSRQPGPQRAPQYFAWALTAVSRAPSARVGSRLPPAVGSR
eukprot:12023937-Alexandrium_andersonii.AAC.1